MAGRTRTRDGSPLREAVPNQPVGHSVTSTHCISQSHMSFVFLHQQVPFWSLLGQGMPLSSPSPLVPAENWPWFLTHLSTSIQSISKSHPLCLLHSSLSCPSSAHWVQALATSPGTATPFSWLQALGCPHHLFSLPCLLISLQCQPSGSKSHGRSPLPSRENSTPRSCDNFYVYFFTLMHRVLQ